MAQQIPTHSQAVEHHSHHKHNRRQSFMIAIRAPSIHYARLLMSALRSKLNQEARKACDQGCPCGMLHSKGPFAGLLAAHDPPCRYGRCSQSYTSQQDARTTAQPQWKQYLFTLGMRLICCQSAPCIIQLANKASTVPQIDSPHQAAEHVQLHCRLSVMILL